MRYRAEELIVSLPMLCLLMHYKIDLAAFCSFHLKGSGTHCNAVRRCGAPCYSSAVDAGAVHCCAHSLHASVLTSESLVPSPSDKHVLESESHWAQRASAACSAGQRLLARLLYLSARRISDCARDDTLRRRIELLLLLLQMLPRRAVK